MLFPSKIVAMQRVADHARTNTYYTSGKTTPEKWPALSAKFAREYGTGHSRFVKHRLRKKGRTTCELIGWQKSETEVKWWLLCSKGRGRVWAHEETKLIQPKEQNDRIQIDGGYELTHDGVSWSWRYADTHVVSLKASIHDAISRKNDARVQELANAIFETAGFRLAREQAGHLVHYMRKTWKRLRHKSEKLILPKQMLYARRLPNPKVDPDMEYGPPDEGDELR